MAAAVVEEETAHWQQSYSAVASLTGQVVRTTGLALDALADQHGASSHGPSPMDTSSSAGDDGRTSSDERLSLRTLLHEFGRSFLDALPQQSSGSRGPYPTAMVERVVDNLEQMTQSSAHHHNSAANHSQSSTTNVPTPAPGGHP